MQPVTQATEYERAGCYQTRATPHMRLGTHPELHGEWQVARIRALEYLPQYLPCGLSHELQHVSASRDVGYQERSQAAQLQYRKNESEHVRLGHQCGIKC